MLLKHPVPSTTPRHLPRHPKGRWESHPTDKISYTKSTTGFLTQTLPRPRLLSSKSLLLPVAEPLTHIWLEGYLPRFNRTETPQLRNSEKAWVWGNFLSCCCWFKVNSHSTELITLNSTQWHLHFQCCVTTTSIQFQTFPSPQKEALYPLTGHSPFHPPPPGSDNHKPAFYLCGFSYAGYFIYVESCSVWLGFFYSA